jgi:hypothetical protein
MKNMLNDSMVNKEKHEDDASISCAYSSSNIVQNVCKVPKISSSMKFYLLKKKFLKKNSAVSIMNTNILNYEEYVI